MTCSFKYMHVHVRTHAQQSNPAKNPEDDNMKGTMSIPKCNKVGISCSVRVLPELPARSCSVPRRRSSMPRRSKPSSLLQTCVGLVFFNMHTRAMGNSIYTRNACLVGLRAVHHLGAIQQDVQAQVGNSIHVHMSGACMRVLGSSPRPGRGHQGRPPCPADGHR